ncbi:hypothetical protein CASFOL_039785 [Castilleja foliolosa]|uniref:Uncharacterized protein n=1 Tax=Castilleja foliolosa TaxID=1961234 RepID=A0ABD3BG70_9LAMI
MVNEKLRVKGHDNIFAIRDIADTPVANYWKDLLRDKIVTELNVLVVIETGIETRIFGSRSCGFDCEELEVVNEGRKGESESKLCSYKPASPQAIVSLGRREGVAQILGLTFVGQIPGMLKSGDMFVGRTRKALGLNAN